MIKWFVVNPIDAKQFLQNDFIYLDVSEDTSRKKKKIVQHGIWRKKKQNYSNSWCFCCYAFRLKIGLIFHYRLTLIHPRSGIPKFWTLTIWIEWWIHDQVVVYNSNSSFMGTLFFYGNFFLFLLIFFSLFSGSNSMRFVFHSMSYAIQLNITMWKNEFQLSTRWWIYKSSGTFNTLLVW